jgi:hypothetical protein
MRLTKITNSTYRQWAAVACLIVATPLVGMAENLTFNKTRFSSVKQPKETAVILSIGDSKIIIKSKETNGIDIEIPFSSINSMSYELAVRHRVKEGAIVMVASLGAGAVLMATKSKSHWLDIEYREGDGEQTTVLHLDKSEYMGVIAALEARTGKSITKLDSKSSALNPTAGSKDVHEVIPFSMERVVNAVKLAMENEGCTVTDATPSRIECKRRRGDSDRTGSGGEKVTAELEASGERTRVRIWTGKGFVGRVMKKNWSTPIYQEMMKGLQKQAQSA